MGKHIIDPTFFYDVIEEFTFSYNIYVREGVTSDENFNRKNTYSKTEIEGSFQGQGLRVKQDSKGNTETETVKFYCKSIYRINKYDVLEYNGNYYVVDEVINYDEYGVREASASMINLAQRQDFSDWLKYIRGDKLV